MIVSPAGCAFLIRPSDKRRKGRPLQGRPAAEIAEKINHCVARRAGGKIFLPLRERCKSAPRRKYFLFEAFVTDIRPSPAWRI
jgi:hypothetical protein